MKDIILTLTLSKTSQESYANQKNAARGGMVVLCQRLYASKLIVIPLWFFGINKHQKQFSIVVCVYAWMGGYVDGCGVVRIHVDGICIYL